MNQESDVTQQAFHRDNTTIITYPQYTIGVYDAILYPHAQGIYAMVYHRGSRRALWESLPYDTSGEVFEAVEQWVHTEGQKILALDTWLDVHQWMYDLSTPEDNAVRHVRAIYESKGINGVLQIVKNIDTFPEQQQTIYREVLTLIS